MVRVLQLRYGGRVVYLMLFVLCVLSGAHWYGLPVVQAVAGALLALVFVLILENLIKALIYVNRYPRG